MNYTSKQHSTGKQDARSFGYSHLTKGQRLGYHVVIVGWDKAHGKFECEDIPYLLSLGIAAARIIACGFGHVGGTSAMEWASQKYGVVASPYDDIVQAVRWARLKKYKLGSVNVDLCGSVLWAKKIVAPILQVANCLVLFTHARFRDGFHADSQRDEKLQASVGMKYDAINTYVSNSYDPTSGVKVKKGCPMRVVVYRRCYKCSKCGVLGKHPVNHVCGESVQVELPIPVAVEESPAPKSVEVVAENDSTRTQTYCSICSRPGHNKATCGRNHMNYPKFYGVGIIGAIDKVIREYHTSHGRGPKCGEILDRIPRLMWTRPSIRVALCNNTSRLWKRCGAYGSSTYEPV